MINPIFQDMKSQMVPRGAVIDALHAKLDQEPEGDSLAQKPTHSKTSSKPMSDTTRRPFSFRSLVPIAASFLCIAIATILVVRDVNPPSPPPPATTTVDVRQEGQPTRDKTTMIKPTPPRATPTLPPQPTPTKTRKPVSTARPTAAPTPKPTPQWDFGEITGLPAKTFIISAGPTRPANPALGGDDISNNPIFRLFEYSGMDAFVIVRATEDARLVAPAAKENYYQSEYSTAVEVVRTLFGETVSQEFQVYQRFYVGPEPALDETGETIQHNGGTLREGGFYVLPVYQLKAGYGIYYGESVLFEIDEDGRIDSHSANSGWSDENGYHHEGWNSYDGKPYTALTHDIVALAYDPDFEAATSLFGYQQRMGCALVEVEVTSDNVKTPSGYDWNPLRLTCDVRVQSVLGEHSLPDNMQLAMDVKEGESGLKKGGRYLLLHRGNYIEELGACIIYPDEIAIIGTDDKISVLYTTEEGEPGGSFGKYEGYTLAQIKQMYQAAQVFALRHQI